MKIRSITFFISFSSVNSQRMIEDCAQNAQAIRRTLESDDITVQTIRLATSSFAPHLSKNNPQMTLDHIKWLENMAIQSGFDYLSIGPALVDIPISYPFIPEILANTRNVFCSAMMMDPQHQIHLNAVKSAAEIIVQAAPLEPDGFANLRFAALANVQPHGPFFPSAFHDDQQKAGYAFAIEAADEVLQVFSSAPSLDQARQSLLTRLEEQVALIQSRIESLRTSSDMKFYGFDISVAPFPSDDISLGKALESLGVSALGLHGSLTAAAFLADTLDRGNWLKTGFNGLMLPLLEDSRLAKRSVDGTLSVKDLLMFSAVCGTGLDTIPLAGNVSTQQIYALLMDISALSARLRKPLTARLMPVPGKMAGELTSFQFSFFANGRILELNAEPLGNHFAHPDEILSIHPRPTH